jgi:hypothetical protein
MTCLPKPQSEKNIKLQLRDILQKIGSQWLMKGYMEGKSRRIMARGQPGQKSRHYLKNN